MSNQSRELEAALREDFCAFIPMAFQIVNPGTAFDDNWHIEAIAWHLQQCAEGNIKRLSITLPPRHLKSIIGSVAFPAWLLGHDPTRQIICVSHSIDLAIKHARDCRAVMAAPWYRRIFPGARISRAKNTETEVVTTRKGFRFTTSIGGTVTGRGGNMLIVDDPIKAEEVTSEAERNRVKDFYDGSLYSRLNNKNEDVIILIMQRLHVDDLIGHVLEKEDWVHLNIPAIGEEACTYQIGDGLFYNREPGDVLHEARENRETLENIKAQLGGARFEAQYQQRPIPPAGNLIKRDWLRTSDEVLTRSDYDLVVQSWDTASTVSEASDYSVGMTFGVKNNTAHILDVVRVRVEYPELRRLVVAEARRYRADVVIIEDANSGVQLAQDLNREGLLRPISFRPKGDKVARLEMHSAALESGYVLLPKSAPENTPWLDDLKTELFAFPNGRHDDQVDALSQFLEWLSVRRWRDLKHKRRRSRKDKRRGSTWSQRVGRKRTSNQNLLDGYSPRRLI